MYIVNNKKEFMSRVMSRKESPVFADFIIKSYYIKRRNFTIIIIAVTNKFKAKYHVPERYKGFEVYSYYGNNLLCGIVNSKESVPLFFYNGEIDLVILHNLIVELYSNEEFRV